MYILTPEQDAQLRRGVQGFPERFPPTPRYPALRPNRNKRGADQMVEPDSVNAALPIDYQGRQGTPHLWPFIITQGAVGQSIAVSPRYSGPGLIDWIFVQTNIAGNAQGGGYQILIADDDAGAGSGVTIVRPSGDPIFDVIGIATSAAQTTPDAQMVGFNTTTDNRWTGYQPLGYRTRKPSFFLKIRLISEAVVGQYLEGYIRVVENLPDYVETA